MKKYLADVGDGFNWHELLRDHAMDYLSQYINPYILLTIFIAIFFIVGWLLERLLLPRISKVAEKTTWVNADYIRPIFKRRISWGFAILGAFLALAVLPFEPKESDIAHKTLNVILIIYTTLLVSNLVVNLFTLYFRHIDPGAEKLPNSSIITNIFRIIILTIGGLMIFNFLGISITPVLTALGVGGLAVALALQDTLGNLFAGLQMVATGKVNPGDYIQLDSGDEGYVLDTSWRNTTLKTILNTVVVIPNSKLGNSIMTNYMQEGRHIIILVYNGVAYDSDLQKVEDVTLSVAKECQREVEGGVVGFKPFMRFTEFGDSNINFAVRLCVREFKDKFLMEHEFIKRLHARYKEEDIEISWPVRIVHHRDLPSASSKV